MAKPRILREARPRQVQVEAAVAVVGQRPAAISVDEDGAGFVDYADVGFIQAMHDGVGSVGVGIGGLDSKATGIGRGGDELSATRSGKRRVSAGVAACVNQARIGEEDGSGGGEDGFALGQMNKRGVSLHRVARELLGARAGGAVGAGDPEGDLEDPVRQVGVRRRGDAGGSSAIAEVPVVGGHAAQGARSRGGVEAVR